MSLTEIPLTCMHACTGISLCQRAMLRPRTGVGKLLDSWAIMGLKI